MTTRTLLAACLAAWMAGANAQTPADAGEPETWGAAPNVTRFGDLYFSAQPDAATFAEARERGITTVINLRAPEEFDWDEAAAADAAGLNYFNIPMSGSAASIDGQVIADISEIVNLKAGEQVLIHCASGNRAAAWFAAYLAGEQGLAAEQAIDIAAEVGLTSPVLRQRVVDFLAK